MSLFRVTYYMILGCLFVLITAVITIWYTGYTDLVYCYAEKRGLLNLTINTLLD